MTFYGEAERGASRSSIPFVMPLRIGLLLYPAIAFLAMRSRKSPPDVLWKAGAVSPETAVHPGGIGITDLRLVADYVKDGLIIRVPGAPGSEGAGLCYVNAAMYHRRRAWGWAVLAALGVALTAFAVFFLWQ
jgi:hypothetical protein